MTTLETAKYPGLGKYRIVQRGLHRFDIQYKLFGLFWIDATEYSSYSLEDAMKTLQAWQADKEVSGRVVWP